jgi:hypothetical protein
MIESRESARHAVGSASSGDLGDQSTPRSRCQIRSDIPLRLQTAATLRFKRDVDKVHRSNEHFARRVLSGKTGSTSRGHLISAVRYSQLAELCGSTDLAQEAHCMKIMLQGYQLGGHEVGLCESAIAARHRRKRLDGSCDPDSLQACGTAAFALILLYGVCDPSGSGRAVERAIYVDAFLAD